MNKWLNIVHTAVLPPLCVLCGGVGSQIHTHSRKTKFNKGLDLCSNCRDELPAHHTACDRCAEPLAAPLINTATRSLSRFVDAANPSLQHLNVVRRCFRTTRPRIIYSRGLNSMVAWKWLGFWESSWLAGWMK